MADINRAAAPINNRNIIQPTKEQRSPDMVPFDFQDTSKVKQTLAESGMSGQYNVLREDGSTSGFYQILRDPAVSSAFLKNIFLLREIVSILPLNNSVQTEEIKALLNNLVISPNEIAGEMMRQEDISTLFKGGLFDMLRDLTNKNQSEELSIAVSNLLKAINNEASKESIFDSINNSLEYLATQFQPSKVLSGKLNSLIDQLADFRYFEENVTGNQSEKQIFTAFSNLKNNIFDVFKDMERSIIYNEDFSKNMSMITYNLSRIDISEDMIPETFARLIDLIPDDTDREKLTNALLKFFDDGIQVRTSKTMNALTDILQKQSDNPEVRMIHSEGIDNIIHSLLSSPCNFTPLLHYVIFAGYDDTQASAEIWINPDAEDEMPEKNKSGKKCMHILSVFEVQEVGKFEAEFFVQGKNIDINVYCPPKYTDFFRETIRDMRTAVRTTSYKIKNINVDSLTKERSLIDVFKSLPQRRQGVNVTI